MFCIALIARGVNGGADGCLYSPRCAAAVMPAGGAALVGG